MNGNFLFLNEKKSDASHPLWENLKLLVEDKNETNKSFYCRVSISMFNYFYRWYLSCMYSSFKTKIPIDVHHLDNIINHFTLITVHIVHPDDADATIDNIVNVFKRAARKDIQNIKTEQPIETHTMNGDIYNILMGDVSENPITLIEKDCLYFDAVGTVIWLWIHLSAARIVVKNITSYDTFWQFFDYIKYILSCGICRHHYDSKVYPLLNKIKSNSQDVLEGSILIHDIVNMNKYETRNDFNILHQSSNKDYYREYLNYWK